MQRVATGAYQIAFADINAVIEYNAKNPGKEIIGVMMAYDFPPFGVYALKKSGIKTPKDLEGKKLGAPVFDASFKPVPGVRQDAWASTAPSVTHVNLTPQLREQSLVQRLGRLHLGPLLLLGARPEGARRQGRGHPDRMRYSDFGMDLYGNGVVVGARDG